MRCTENVDNIVEKEQSYRRYGTLRINSTADVRDLRAARILLKSASIALLFRRLLSYRTLVMFYTLKATFFNLLIHSGVNYNNTITSLKAVLHGRDRLVAIRQLTVTMFYLYCFFCIVILNVL